eukprot:913781-Alexandrium_andersonii.AAC.1
MQGPMQSEAQPRKLHNRSPGGLGSSPTSNPSEAMQRGAQKHATRSSEEVQLATGVLEQCHWTRK